MKSISGFFDIPGFHGVTGHVATEVQWFSRGNEWFKLNNLDLKMPELENLEGVYIIWHGGDIRETVRVGQGRIRERLIALRDEPTIQAFSRHGLYVTWATVPASIRDGVELYLAETLQPKAGSRYPVTSPIEVNLPW